jgi:hypothetical protein
VQLVQLGQKLQVQLEQQVLLQVQLVRLAQRARPDLLAKHRQSLVQQVQPVQLVQQVRLARRVRQALSQVQLDQQVRAAGQPVQLDLLAQLAQLDQKSQARPVRLAQEALLEDKVRLAQQVRKVMKDRLAQQDRQQHHATRLIPQSVTVTQATDHSDTTVRQSLSQHLSTLTTLTLQVTRKRCGMKHGTTQHRLLKDLLHSAVTQT